MSDSKNWIKQSMLWSLWVCITVCTVWTYHRITGESVICYKFKHLRRVLSSCHHMLSKQELSQSHMVYINTLINVSELMKNWNKSWSFNSKVLVQSHIFKLVSLSLIILPITRICLRFRHLRSVVKQKWWIPIYITYIDSGTWEVSCSS